LIDAVELSAALEWLTNQVSEADQYLSTTQPWKESDAQKRQTILTESIHKILNVAIHLQPFLPQTSKKIIDHFSAPKISAFETALFPRLS
jgi:methionyl-tRNA synthetase